MLERYIFIFSKCKKDNLLDTRKDIETPCFCVQN